MADSDSARSTLSVAMIVRNAEEILADTLDSVRSIADEIVVCDTGSTDATVDVAARLATKVLAFPWDDDFSAARNACLEHISGDWVLWLDAGERVDREDADGLRAFVNAGPDRSKAFMLLVKVPPPNPHVAAEQIAQPRLVPNRPGIQFAGRVRETLSESFAQAGILIEGLQCSIHRTQRDHDPKVKLLKARRNLQLCELALRENGPHATWLNCKAEALVSLDNRAEAAKLFRQAVKTAEPGSLEMLDAYYGLLMALDGVPDAATAQISVCLEALEVYPCDAQLLCALGGYLQKEGRIDLARRSYETAYKFGQVDPQVWHLQEIASFSAVCYSLSLELSDREDEAVQVLKEAIERDPDSLRLHRRLLEWYVKRGRMDDALAQLDASPVSRENQEAMRTAVRGASLAGQKNWLSARSYLETAYAANCRDVLCLRWLSLTLISLGRLADAEPVLRQWEATDVTNVEPKHYLAAIARAGEDRNATPKRVGVSADPAASGASLTANSRNLRFDAPATGIPRHPKSGSPLPTTPDPQVPKHLPT
jgi:tetratricopeptide (TPR) repeat protein